MRARALSAALMLGFAVATLGCASNADPNVGAEREVAQSWSAASDSALAPLGIASYVLARDAEGGGFALYLRDAEGATVDIVRVRVASGERLIATLATRPSEFVFWSEAGALGGDHALRARIAHYLNGAAADVLSAVGEQVRAPSSRPRLAPRGGLIDLDGPGLFAPEAAEPVRCATGLVHSLIAAAAAFIREATGGVVDISVQSTSSKPVVTISIVLSGTGSASAGNQCTGEEAPATPEVEETRSFGCVDRGLAAVAGGAGISVCGGQGIVVLLCAEAPVRALDATVSRMCANRCGVACRLHPAPPPAELPAVCPWPETPDHCCLHEAGATPEYRDCKDDGSYRAGESYAVRR